MKLKIEIQEQPDDSTCGPTCLHSVYNYYQNNIGLDDVIKSTKTLDDGGTLGVLLGLDALKRGFDTRLYTLNLKVFDPSWANLDAGELIEKLEKQLAFKNDKKFQDASKAYVEYLKNGGELLLQNLTTKLIKKYLSDGYPILTGLSATYLYQTPRELYLSNNQSIYDDLKGEPLGHFVVLFGIREKYIYVADPYRGNPFTKSSYYKVEADRLLSAILLGILTYDANLLIIKPKNEENHSSNQSQEL